MTPQELKEVLDFSTPVNARCRVSIAERQASKVTLKKTSRSGSVSGSRRVSLTSRRVSLASRRNSRASPRASTSRRQSLAATGEETPLPSSAINTLFLLLGKATGHSKQATAKVAKQPVFPSTSEQSNASLVHIPKTPIMPKPDAVSNPALEDKGEASIGAPSALPSPVSQSDRSSPVEVNMEDVSVKSLVMEFSFASTLSEAEEAAPATEEVRSQTSNSRSFKSSKSLLSFLPEDQQSETLPAPVPSVHRDTCTDTGKKKSLEFQ
jgi:hypothetical protein